MKSFVTKTSIVTTLILVFACFSFAQVNLPPHADYKVEGLAQWQKNALAQGSPWGGYYNYRAVRSSVKPTKQNPFPVFEFHEHGVWSIKRHQGGELPMYINFREDPEFGFSYDWERDLRSTGENDDKTCDQRNGYTVASINDREVKTISRSILSEDEVKDYLSYLYKGDNDQIEAKIKAFVNDSTKAKVVSPQNKIVAFLAAKECQGGSPKTTGYKTEKGGKVYVKDLFIPLVYLSVETNGGTPTKLTMRAMVGEAPGNPGTMAYTSYDMNPNVSSMNWVPRK